VANSLKTVLKNLPLTSLHNNCKKIKMLIWKNTGLQHLTGSIISGSGIPWLCKSEAGRWRDKSWNTSTTTRFNHIGTYAHSRKTTGFPPLLFMRKIWMSLKYLHTIWMFFNENFRSVRTPAKGEKNIGQ
jgi:hypothetical protein